MRTCTTIIKLPKIRKDHSIYLTRISRSQVIASTPEGVMAWELQGDEEVESLNLPEGANAKEIARDRLASSEALDDIYLDMLVMVM